MVSRRVLVAVSLVSMVLALGVTAAAGAYSPPHWFCSKVGHSIGVSSGAQMYCFGSQPSTGGAVHGGTARLRAPARTLASATPVNVNTANLSEDVSSGGVRAYGQSETSVASVGPYVVEAFNDSTSFFSNCPAPMSKEEGTGWSFSSDGGASFTDQGGVHNPFCSTHLTEGDPSVEAWRSGTSSYFYISTLYPSVNVNYPANFISVSACKVIGSGSTARIACADPTIAAASTECVAGPPTFCSFLDKDFMSIDPVHGRLYITYTEFGFQPTTANGQVDVAVCDIGTPAGGTGPAGGSAGRPVCEHGSPTTNPAVTGKPYLAVAPGDLNCESEGAYPAPDPATGDLYVGYEFNWVTNFLNPACFDTPTRVVLARIAAKCLVLAASSPCSAATTSTSQAITSMDSALVPGYNRPDTNDFPRIAVTPSAGTVSLVWNDARSNPLGDILLRSWSLGTLTPVQAAPVRLNANPSGLHFLPGLRNSSAAGKLAVMWYDRADATTTLTDVRAALSVDPRAASTPAANTLITSVPSDWNADSSDIVPNFGDYTDDYATGGRVFFSWSDGRLGEPQPFEANLAMP